MFQINHTIKCQISINRNDIWIVSESVPLIIMFFQQTNILYLRSGIDNFGLNFSYSGRMAELFNTFFDSDQKNCNKINGSGVRSVKCSNFIPLTQDSKVKYLHSQRNNLKQNIPRLNLFRWNEYVFVPRAWDTNRMSLILTTKAYKYQNKFFLFILLFRNKVSILNQEYLLPMKKIFHSHRIHPCSIFTLHYRVCMR